MQEKKNVLTRIFDRHLSSKIISICRVVAHKICVVSDTQQVLAIKLRGCTGELGKEVYVERRREWRLGYSGKKKMV